jgi:hypothetical protein
MKRILALFVLIILALCSLCLTGTPTLAQGPPVAGLNREPLAWRPGGDAQLQAVPFSLDHGVFYRLSDGFLVMGILRYTGDVNVGCVQVTVGLFESSDDRVPAASRSTDAFLCGLRPGESTPFFIAIEWYEPYQISAIGLTDVQATPTGANPVESLVMVNPQLVSLPGGTTVSGLVRNVLPNRPVQIGAQDIHEPQDASAVSVALYDQDGQLAWITRSIDQELTLSPGEESAFAASLYHDDTLQVSRWEIWVMRGGVESSGGYSQDPYLLFTPTEQRWQGDHYVVDGVARYIGRLVANVCTSLVYRDAQGRILRVSRQCHKPLEGCATLAVQHKDPYAPVGFAAVEIRAVTDIVEGFAPPADLPPPIHIDAPPEQTVIDPPHLSVTGWTVHLNNGCTTGIDAVHVYLDAGEDPWGQFLGPADYGLARPDIAQGFGSHYSPSGYQGTFDISALSPGTYNLYVHAHSLFSGWHYRQRVIEIAPRHTPTPTNTPLPTATPTATRPLLPVGYLPLLLKNDRRQMPTMTPTSSVTVTPTATDTATATTTLRPTGTPTLMLTATTTTTATTIPTTEATPTMTATPTHTPLDLPSPTVTVTLEG